MVIKDSPIQLSELLVSISVSKQYPQQFLINRILSNKPIYMYIYGNISIYPYNIQFSPICIMFSELFSLYHKHYGTSGSITFGTNMGDMRTSNIILPHSYKVIICCPRLQSKQTGFFYFLFYIHHLFSNSCVILHIQLPAK